MKACEDSTSVALLIRNVSSFCSRLLWEVIRLVSLLDRPSLLEWIPTPGIGIFFIRDLCPSQLLGMPGSFSVKTLPRARAKKGVLTRRQDRNEKRGIRGGDVAVASLVSALLLLGPFLCGLLRCFLRRHWNSTPFQFTKFHSSSC